MLEFNQIALANARGSEAMINRVMTKDNIGVATVLEFIEPQRQQSNTNATTTNPTTNQRILVCNTHIHWDPEYCDVKLIQTILLMNELKCIAKHYTNNQPSIKSDSICNSTVNKRKHQGSVDETNNLQTINNKRPSESTNSLGGDNFDYDDDNLSVDVDLDPLLHNNTNTVLSSNSTDSIFASDNDADADTDNEYNDKQNISNNVETISSDKIKNIGYINDNNHEFDLLPLVLLGDFNSLPNSGVTTYLTEGKIDSSHKDFKEFKYTHCTNALSINNLIGSSINNNGAVNYKTSNTRQGVSHQQSNNLTSNNSSVLNSTRRSSSPAWYFYTSSSTSSSPISSETASSYSSSPPNSSTGSLLSVAQPYPPIQKQQPASVPTSTVINQSHSEEQKILNYEHPFNLLSAYEKDTMPYTNYTHNFKAIIDYIFYTRNSLQLVGLLGPLDRNWIKENRIRGLPQPHLPSDHLPLLVKLKVTQSNSSLCSQQFSCNNHTTTLLSSSSSAPPVQSIDELQKRQTLIEQSIVNMNLTEANDKQVARLKQRATITRNSASPNSNITTIKHKQISS